MDKDSTQGVAGKGKANSATSTLEEEKAKELTTLKRVWIIWEQMQGIEKSQKGQGEKEYRENLQEVGQFDNIVSFWQLWNKVPHSNPAELFTLYDEAKQSLVQPLYVATLSQNIRFEIAGRMKKIIALCLFQKGILPAWEDKQNKFGGDFNVVVKNCSKETLKNYWEGLTLKTISGDLEYPDAINGIRVVDKPYGADTNYKFEIWVNFAEEESEKFSYFQNWLRKFFDSPILYSAHNK